MKTLLNKLAKIDPNYLVLFIIVAGFVTLILSYALQSELKIN